MLTITLASWAEVRALDYAINKGVEGLADALVHAEEINVSDKMKKQLSGHMVSLTKLQVQLKGFEP